MGSVTDAATRSRPGNLVRANHQARGRPNGMARMVASRATLNDRSRGKKSIGSALTLTLFHRGKPVFANYALALWTQDETQKPPGQVRPRTVRDNRRAVA